MNRSPRRLARLSLLVWAGLALAGCNSDEVTGPQPATVLVVPSGEVTLEGVGATRQLSAQVTDARGRPLTDPLVAWTTSDAGVAEVNSQGLVTATGSGETQVTATAGSASGTVRVVVLGGVQIVTSSLPDARLTLSYSDRAVATGGTPPYSWSLVGGTPPGGITFNSQGILSGTPQAAGSSTLRIRVQDAQGESSTRNLAFRVCPAPLALTVGGWTAVPAPGPAECALFLPAGASGDRYRVALLRTTANPAAPDSTPVATTLVTRRLGPGTAALPPQAISPPAAVAEGLDPLPLTPSLLRDLGRDARTSRVHAQMRRDEERLIRELGPGAAVLPDLGRESLPGAAAVAAAPSPSRITVIPYNEGRCTNPPPVRVGTLVEENDLMAIYQDSIQRTSSPVSAADARLLLDYYRDHGAQVIDQYFGGVSDIDGNGRVVVFVSPAVGSGVAAFVWSGDFFPRTGTNACAASNEMELIYFNAQIVREMSASGTQRGYQALSTLVHEVKHVSSLYNRLQYGLANPGTGSPYHAAWLEEGTAEVAAEISSRLAWAARGGPPLGARIRRQDFAAVGFTPDNWGVVLRLARTVDFLASQPNSVFMDPDGASDRHSFYGSSWHLHRFLGDAYAGGSASPQEATFFQAQNARDRGPGPASFQTLLGKGFQNLMEEFVAAILLHFTGAPEPERGFAGYDFLGATDVFSTPNPNGVYPWPVTTTGQDPNSIPSAPFATANFGGNMAQGGVRIHDFLSNGTGFGLEVSAAAAVSGTPMRMVVARLR